MMFLQVMIDNFGDVFFHIFEYLNAYFAWSAFLW